MLYNLSKVFSNPLPHSGCVNNETAEKIERKSGDIWFNNRENGVQVSSIRIIFVVDITSYLLYISYLSRVLSWFMTKRNESVAQKKKKKEKKRINYLYQGNNFVWCKPTKSLSLLTKVINYKVCGLAADPWCKIYWPTYLPFIWNIQIRIRFTEKFRPNSTIVQ